MTHERGATMQSLCCSRVVFAAACGLLFAVICLALPPYFPLFEPDSAGYVAFSANRTALYPLFLRAFTTLGVSLPDITYVQTACFSIGLGVLVSAMERSGIGRRWIVAFVMALGINFYFSAFQRTLMTESIGFTAIAVATAFLLDYFRTGRVLFLALCGLFVGLTVGIRPAGVTILPTLALAAWLMWHRRDVSGVLLLVALVGPPLAGWGSERLSYYIEHGNRNEAITPYILTGKAAMLVTKDTRYTGPHAAALSRLGAKLYDAYVPAHAFLSGVPSWVAWPVLTAFYEGAAQFQVISYDLVLVAKEEGTTPEQLRTELGKQAILANIPGYIRLTLTHYLGQWSITALTFPPAARAVKAYSDSVQKIPLYAEITDVPFHPEPSWKSIVAYPGFAIAGIVTFVLSFLLLRYLFNPRLADTPAQHDLMLAAFFAAMCHSSMLLTSMVNVSTPRFLMMVYPHILLAGLFLMRAWRPAWVRPPLTTPKALLNV